LPRQTEIIELSSPNPGSSRHLRVHRYGTPGARPKAYVHSSLHAGEWPGLLVLHHLTRLLDDADRDGKIIGEIILLPFANPIGLGQRIHGGQVGRFHLDGGGNFNRGWPNLTEPVAKAVDGNLSHNNGLNINVIREALVGAVGDLSRADDIAELRATLLGLSIDANIVIDLHCDSLATLHVYANSAQVADALILTRDLGSPVLLLEDTADTEPFDGANYGPWVKLCQRFNLDDNIAEQCFGVTVELRGENDVSDDLALQDARALFRFLTRKGIIDGDPGPLPEAQCQATPLDGVDVGTAPATGVVVWHKNPGDAIAEGDHIADLVDIEASDPKAARTPIHARTTGYMFARKSAVLVRAGDQLFKIAGLKSLAYRKQGSLLAP